MSSKAKAPSVEEQEVTAEEVPAPPDPTPKDVSDYIAGQQASNIKSNRKGRSWSLLSRTGSDSRRTVLNSGNMKLG